MKCPYCGEIIPLGEYSKHYDVCPKRMEELKIAKPEIVMVPYEDFKIGIPVGELPLTPPEEDLYKIIFNELKNQKNWKAPPPTIKVTNKETADFIGNIFQYSLGGTEIAKVKDGYLVGSRGYYHYMKEY